MPKIGIIDYRAGNAESVAAAVTVINVPYQMVNSPADLEAVDAIILPGVGSAGATMESLDELGLIGPMTQFVIERRRPFLGICVGLQIIFTKSEEDNATCLGWLPGTVRQFDQTKLRVPQIGWNEVTPTRDHPIFDGIESGCYTYFVNSYHAFPDNDDVLVGTVDYGGRSTAIIGQQNIWATQFHAEKSGPVGLRMLQNFVNEGAKC